MGRFLPTLGASFADAAGVTAGGSERVLDVGCGPGGLTRVLVARVGADRVAGGRVHGRPVRRRRLEAAGASDGGAGPVGAYARSLPPDVADRVRAGCDRLLGHPRAPFTLEAFAWCAVGTS